MYQSRLQGKWFNVILKKKNVKKCTRDVHSLFIFMFLVIYSLMKIYTGDKKLDCKTVSFFLYSSHGRSELSPDTREEKREAPILARKDEESLTPVSFSVFTRLCFPLRSHLFSVRGILAKVATVL